MNHPVDPWEELRERRDVILGAGVGDPREISLSGEVLGRSREGRPIRGYRLGSGPGRVSLLAGCHADEPVGPRLLSHLVDHLARLAEGDPLLRRWTWWIVPHANPDGARRNRLWYGGRPERFDVADYLRLAVREKPGDDVEFGFPRDPEDRDARPENRAVHAWWRSADGPFDLHVSLHGMATGAGPWFLVDPAWTDRCGRLRRRCVERTEELGYELHDVERGGEKGFHRIAPGFATRPSSRAMRDHFLERGDEATARLFRPSSMEAVRKLGGDPLTLVPEVPLFVTPGVGREIGPPDPAAERWRDRLASWRRALAERGEDAAETVREEAGIAGLRAVPVRDQMDLQWTLIVAGLEQVEAPPG